MRLLLTALLVALLALPKIVEARLPDCLGNSEGARDDGKLGHRFQENCAGVTYLENGEVVPFTSNRMGLRDKDYERQAAGDVFRILLIGASQEMNHSNMSGFGFAFEKRLNELLRGGARKKIKKIEVINGSERAYNTLRSYLRQSELLSEYSPNLVIYVDPFLDLFLEEYFDHYRATGRDREGIVSFMGPYGRFWPIPERATARLWGWPFSIKLFHISAVVRMTLLLYGQEIFGGFVDCPTSRGNCLLHWHMQYLNRIEKLISSYRAELLFVFGRRIREDFPLELKADYLPSYWAERLFPLPVLSSGEIERYLVYMRQKENAWEMAKEMQAIYEESYRRVLDLHPPEKEANLLGKIMAEHLFPRIKLGASL